MIFEAMEIKTTEENGKALVSVETPGVDAHRTRWAGGLKMTSWLFTCMILFLNMRF